MQRRLGPALRLDALTLITRLHLLALCRLAVRFVRHRCSSPVPATQAAHITIAFLPFRAPELMPCEDLWRRTKAVVAANRVYASVQELAERFNKGETVIS
jgi:hypothetical protein